MTNQPSPVGLLLWEGLHNVAGREWISDMAGACCSTILAEGLVAAPVGVTAPLDRVG